ncbi:hypothetical protein [uncultured Sphingomonas sp.]|uniref:hypothetical protein n=1 Tax=uncultured Sphingomonas sp. TaxID=158754 RepID=UPI0025FA59C5|nr:hypothetical protein [uncultured Sphingomonas sp.]
MTVAAKPATISYIEDGVSVSFAVPFRFKAASDLVVERLGDGSVITLQLGTDYTVTGGATDAGGTLTRTVATAGATLRITRDTARAQPMTYATGDRFPAASHEEALDRQMLVAQEQDAKQADTISRALLLPPGEVAPDLAPQSQRVGPSEKMIGFTVGGVPIVKEIDQAYRGPAGLAANTFASLDEMKRLDPARFASAVLADGVHAPLQYALVYGDFSAVADDLITVAIAALPVTQAALVLQAADGVAFRQFGDGARPQTLKEKLGQSVSTADFVDPQQAVARFGASVTQGVSAKVHVARGTTMADSIGAQGTALVGDARVGSVIKARSGGASSLIDARLNRDGTTANTQGHAHIENLSLDLNNKARVGATVYGGSNIVRNTQIYNLTSGSTGLGIQYVLMTRVDQVTVTGGGIGFEVNVDPLHAGDVNTSLVMTVAWSLRSGTGFKVDHLQYSTFLSCCSQEATGWGYIFDGATGDAVTSMNGITVISCGSEVNAGGAFYMKGQRSTSLINPFIIPVPNADTVRWESSIGQIVGLRDTAIHTGGTVGLRIVSPLGLGLLLIDGGDFPMLASDLKYCTFRAAIVNGALRDSVTNLWFNAAVDSQMVQERIEAVPGDFPALKRKSASGMVLGGERISGGHFISNGGPLVDPANALAANEGFQWWDATGLKTIVKLSDGTIKLLSRPWDT